MAGKDSFTIVSPGQSKGSLGFWMWIYVIGRLTLAPFMLLRSIRHVTDPVYTILLTVGVLVGAAAAILLLLRHRLVLPFIGADLLIRLFVDCEFFIHGTLHPTIVSRHPGVHAVTLYLITLLVGVVPCCLWFLYFNQSHRVRDVYNANLASWLIPPPFSQR